MGELAIDVNSDQIWQLRATSTTTSPTVDTAVVSCRPDATSITQNTASLTPSTASNQRIQSSTMTSLRRTLSNLAHSSQRLFIRSKGFTCQFSYRVTLLDGQTVSFNLQKNALGIDLLHSVTSHLNIEETWHFGLSYFPNEMKTLDRPTSFVVPSGPFSITRSSTSCHTPGHSPFAFRLNSRRSQYMDDVPLWLDMKRRISDQCKSDYTFYFEIKHYTPHPERLITCPNTRYQYVLQLRQNLITGRLSCSLNTHVLLGALISQIELGDSHPRHSARSSRSHSMGNTASNRSSVSQSSCSTRTCSLASPEVSDTEDLGDKSKCATIGPISWTTSECPFSDPKPTMHLTHSDVLPHLHHRSKSADARMFPDRQRGGTQSFGPNWPYPSPVFRQSPTLVLRRVAALHRRLRGWPRSKAEHHFLDTVRRFALYGVELHRIQHFIYSSCSKRHARPFSMHHRTQTTSQAARHERSSHKTETYSSDLLSPRFDLSLGVSSLGLLLLWGQIRLQCFPWSRILSVSERHAHCFVTVDNSTTALNRKQLPYRRFVFKFSSSMLCSRFFHSFVDHHRCFRLGIHHTSHPVLTGVGFNSLGRNRSDRVLLLSDSNPHSPRRLMRTQSERNPSLLESVPNSSKRLLCWASTRSDDGSPPTANVSLQATPEPASTIADALSSLDSRAAADLDSVPGTEDDDVWVAQQQHCTPPSPVRTIRAETIAIPPCARSRINCAQSDTSPLVNESHQSTDLVTPHSFTTGPPLPFDVTSPVTCHSHRPDPPPRPRLPSSLTVEMPATDYRDVLIAPSFWSIPVVPTHACVVDQSGRLIRLSPSNATSSDHVRVHRGSSFGPRTSLGPSNLPVIPTRTIRYPSVPLKISQFMILQSAVVHSIDGSRVPLVPTKSVYMR